MKLKFTKDQDGNISVMFVHEGKEYNFNYVSLINVLYYKKYIIEEPEFIGDFDEHEVGKIKEMFSELSDATVQKEAAL